jgi:hypothetical protein
VFFGSKNGCFLGQKMVKKRRICRGFSSGICMETGGYKKRKIIHQKNE